MVFNLVNMTNATFSVAQAKSTTRPLLWFILGIVIYAVFIFKFYRFLARKNVFQLHLHKYSASLEGSIEKFVRVFLYILEFLVIFPLFIFFWFAVVAFILMMLSKNPLGQILLIAMALVASVRITAYYNEDLAKDLAKMFPFALLGVFLADMSSFSFASSLAIMKQLPSQWQTLLYYLGFLVLLELVLRLITFMWHWVRGDKKDKSDEKDVPPSI